jgi:phage terminase large subunit-like protein
MVIIEVKSNKIEIKLKKHLIVLEFDEQIELFHLLINKIKKKVEIKELEENKFSLELKEPYLTFIYRWLKGIETGEVSKTDIRKSKLLPVIMS